VSRPLKIRLHVNRHELRKGAEAWPWTIHTSRACTPAREVVISIPMVSEYQPEKRQNPRLWLVGRGRVVDRGEGRYALVP
jgi:hypothetical protein